MKALQTTILVNNEICEYYVEICSKTTIDEFFSKELNTTMENRKYFEVQFDSYGHKYLLRKKRNSRGSEITEKYVEIEIEEGE